MGALFTQIWKQKDSKNFYNDRAGEFAKDVSLCVSGLLEMRWLIDPLQNAFLDNRLTPRCGQFIVTFREPVFIHLILFALIAWKRFRDRQQRAATHEAVLQLPSLHEANLCLLRHIIKTNIEEVLSPALQNLPIYPDTWQHLNTFKNQGNEFNHS